VSAIASRASHHSLASIYLGDRTLSRVGSRLGRRNVPPIRPPARQSADPAGIDGSLESRDYSIVRRSGRFVGSTERGRKKGWSVGADGNGFGGGQGEGEWTMDQQ
jgi:hypothetical protein